ncbi:hypothetical protein AMS68_007280 [Peltaster fructicola]|uniref:Uncharacterized protein n=1 Tax=Peltaster fructicola TaxID=286661 RepID=A0A6H0Y433_9PEZI|nr:hypothetical protein AMS68_007280 [Peltaster fructicola]
MSAPPLPGLLVSEESDELNTDDFGNGSIKTAAARLAQEARQMVGFSRTSMKDITQAFNDASELLECGQLIKDDYFTLFEAVGALEIMDPKMDTGVVLPADTDVLEEDPAVDLTAAELIWVLDELICLEIAWLEDHPLSQTLFTSIHIDRLLDPENRYPYQFELRPDKHTQHTLTNQVLHAYCLTLVKCNSMVLDLARSQGFYEEEDFVSHTFGRDLLPDLTTDAALARLEDALQWIDAHVSDATMQKALKARLTFRKLFIRSIFGQVNGWQDMINLLDHEIENTRDMALPRPVCFTDTVLRHLATSTPPRPKLVTSWANAKPQWKKFCSDVAEAPQLTSFWIRQSPACLQRAMWTFAARRPSTFPRSVIQDIMFVDGRIADDVSHFDLLLTDIRELVLPGHLVSDPDSFQIEAVSDVRHKCSRLMEEFLDGVLDEYLNLYRLTCQNRARIRRHLTQAIATFELLETQHAPMYDARISAELSLASSNAEQGTPLPRRSLATWVRYYKLKVMADSVLLGFETDVYMPDEMAHMYWYLSSLLNERRMLLEYIEACTQRHAATLPSQGANTPLSECLIALQWCTTLKLELDVSIQLANALSHLFSILLHMGLVKAPPRTLATPDMLHEARMRIYLTVKDPAPPSLEDFVRARTLSAEIPEVLDRIDAEIKIARTGLSALKTIPADVAKYVGTEDRWKSEIKQLETTAVAIFVAATQLRRAQMKSSSETTDWYDSLEASIPPPEKRYHESWIVPQVKEKR